MTEMTPVKIAAIATIVWIGLWTLLFDSWFFWSPLGLLLVFVLPAGAWIGWWKWLRVEGEEMTLDEMRELAREGVANLSKLKQRLTREK